MPSCFDRLCVLKRSLVVAEKLHNSQEYLQKQIINKTRTKDFQKNRYKLNGTFNNNIWDTFCHFEFMEYFNKNVLLNFQLKKKLRRKI